jgi:hypothetical protein
MATWIKYDIFSEHRANNVHDFFGTDHTLKIMLSNTAPNVATHTVRADASELAAGNGYTSGGADINNNGTRSGATTNVAAVTVSWTATGGTIGPFRYVILYNDTPTSPADPLIAYFDNGTPAVTLAIGQNFSVNLPANILSIT